MKPDPNASKARQLYLDLIKKVLTNLIYGDDSFAQFHDSRHEFDPHSRPRAFDQAARRDGNDWPVVAHTMVGIKRLDNVQSCVERVLTDEIPGDFIEAGVWRGGVCIFMRALLEAHGRLDRNVWVADSFAGLPAPTTIDDIRPYGAENDPRFDRRQAERSMRAANEVLSVPQSVVQENFEKYGLLDDRVRFLAGWFKDTLPAAPIDQLSVLRLDSDYYESTMDTLENLYPKLSPGGFAIVDDYLAVPGCRKAVNQFRSTHGIVDPIRTIDGDLERKDDDPVRGADGNGVYWRRLN